MGGDNASGFLGGKTLEGLAAEAELPPSFFPRMTILGGNI